MQVRITLIDWQCYSKVKSFLDDVKPYITEYEEVNYSYPNGVSYTKYYIKLDIDKDVFEKIYDKYKNSGGYDFYFGKEFSMFESISVA